MTDAACLQDGRRVHGHRPTPGVVKKSDHR